MSRFTRTVTPISLLLTLVGACRSPEQWARQVRTNDELTRRVAELEREAAACQAKLQSSEGSAARLVEMGSDRPVDLFAPVRVEIDKLTGGDNYDGAPGDDGVTVYLQPLDSDGNVVKVPGRIRVQLLDNTDLSQPRVIQVCEYSDPADLRKSWHGRFLTNHYTLKCAFPPDAQLPASGELLATVSFVDYLTGRELSAHKIVTFSRAAGTGVGATP
jgi:hypothetical protein